MTTIAFDGKTLAADKQSTNAGLARTVTKIFMLQDGPIAFTGSGPHITALLEWFQGGRDPYTWPRESNPDECGNAIHVTKEGIFVYWGSSTHGKPEKVEDKQMAFGAGRDYALAAMYLGLDAVRAVEVAAHFDLHTGMGVDSFDLEE